MIDIMISEVDMIIIVKVITNDFQFLPKEFMTERLTEKIFRGIETDLMIDLVQMMIPPNSIGHCSNMIVMIEKFLKLLLKEEIGMRLFGVIILIIEECLDHLIGNGNVIVLVLIGITGLFLYHVV